MPILTTLAAASAKGLGFSGGSVVGAKFSIGGSTYDLGAGDVYNVTAPFVRDIGTMLNTGSFKVKMWGGGGGAGNPAGSSGGTGGFSSGTVSFTDGTTFVVSVGGAGQGQANGGTPSLGGANGGGNGDNSNNRGGGGGFSGIFVGPLQVQPASVMIAGGGGGGGNPGPATNHYGGSGGGTTGRNSSINDGNPNYLATGGSQAAGGLGWPYTPSNDGLALQGSNAVGTGAGGGYWGGGGGGIPGPYSSGSGGGSGHLNPVYVKNGSTEQGPDAPLYSPPQSSDPIRGTAGRGGLGNSAIESKAGRVYLYWDE